jgi:hypothetical protein
VICVVPCLEAFARCWVIPTRQVSYGGNLQPRIAVSKTGVQLVQEIGLPFSVQIMEVVKEYEQASTCALTESRHSIMNGRDEALVVFWFELTTEMIRPFVSRIIVARLVSFGSPRTKPSSLLSTSLAIHRKVVCQSSDLNVCIFSQTVTPPEASINRLPSSSRAVLPAPLRPKTR